MTENEKVKKGPWKRHPNPKYKGIRYREHPFRKHHGEPDCYFAVRFQRENGKFVEIGLGWSSDGMNFPMAYKKRLKHIDADSKGEAITGKEKKESAKKKAKEEEAEEERQKKENFSFSQLMEEHYLPWAETNKRHVRDDVIRFKVHLAEALGGKPLKEITPFMLEGLKKRLQEKGLAPATVKHCLALIRQAFNKAVTWGLWHGDNPIRGVKIPRLDNAKMRTLTTEEENLLMSALKARSQQTYEMSMMSLYSGMRYAEVAGLKWQDIIFEHSIINVKGKGGRPRRVPLHDRLKELLEARRLPDDSPSDLIYPDQKGNVQTRISALFYRVVEQLGLNAGRERKYRVDYHSLRHTFGTRLARRAPITVVRDTLGHSNLIMTSRYSHESPDMAMLAVQSLGQEGQEINGNGAAVIPLKQ